MHKRILCLILTGVLLLSLIPAISLPARATSNMKTSEACISILKSMEGFARYPYFDYLHYSVGYGSTCEEGDYPDGITEEEADALMRQFLAGMELELNRFADRNDILFSQYQFDALMLFTYNCGAGWMYETGDFRQAVIDDATGNDFIFPFTLWSAAGGEIHPGLVKRRLREANMYLNGIYDSALPESYTYAFYDYNGGTGTVKVHGYDYSQKAPVKAWPTRAGYMFLGWYTAREGGQWVRYLTAEQAQQSVYAQWQKTGTEYTDANLAYYQIPAEELVSLDTYYAPGGMIVGTLHQNDMAVVEADYVDAEGVKWGRLISGGWVILGDPLVGINEEEPGNVGVHITITGDYVNIRTGPGTGYPVIAGVLQDDLVKITQVVVVGDMLWGKCRAGWLCLDYSDYSGGLPAQEPTADIPQIPGTPTVPETQGQTRDTVIGVGIVVPNQLCIRSAAGSRGTPVGNYRKGDRVALLERTTILGTDWGRTDKGWICLLYVDLNGEQDGDPTNPAETTASDRGVHAKNEGVPRGYPATVDSKSGLNVRSKPGIGGNPVHTYASGEKIWILEQTSVNGTIWGRTEHGWISLQYAYMADTGTGEETVYGIITAPDGLSVRSGAGVGCAPVDTYEPDTRIQILEQAQVDGQTWGRTDKGWVCMDHVQLEDADMQVIRIGNAESAVTQPEDIQFPVPWAKDMEVSGTVMATRVNVRQLPGSVGEVVGHYRRGDEITVLETRQVDGISWGRTDKGWISLVYVELEDATAEEPIFIGEVTLEGLCIRQGPGSGNSIVGVYGKGQTVCILEQIRVGMTLWGRTDRGWVCMEYVK